MYSVSRRDGRFIIYSLEDGLKDLQNTPKQTLNLGCCSLTSSRLCESNDWRCSRLRPASGDEDVLVCSKYNDLREAIAMRHALGICRSNSILNGSELSTTQNKLPPQLRLRRECCLPAERQGFEPWVPSRVLRFSRPVQSAALPPLRLRNVAEEILWDRAEKSTAEHTGDVDQAISESLGIDQDGGTGELAPSNVWSRGQ